MTEMYGIFVLARGPVNVICQNTHRLAIHHFGSLKVPQCQLLGETRIWHVECVVLTGDLCEQRCLTAAYLPFANEINS